MFISLKVGLSAFNIMEMIKFNYEDYDRIIVRLGRTLKCQASGESSALFILTL